ncbi:MAG: LysE family transporter [Bacteroidota bacterium]|jgi:threonine/homoserine/homoserine lactone efflux protein
MILLLIAFSLSFAISFVGSIQPGPVNLAVLSSSLQQKYRNAIFVAVGGSWPEFVFCFIALKAANFVIQWEQYFVYFQVLIILLLLIIAIYLWFNKKSVIAKSTNKKGFILGSFLAIINPQLILFWTTIITYIHINKLFNINLFENNKMLIFFAVGASFGAFVLHLLLIYLSKVYIKLPINTFFAFADKTIAIIFVILAIIQTINIIY